MTTTIMIEASSPLAAMHGPSFVSRCGFGQDTVPSYASFARANFGPDSFNFKDLSMMKRSRSDYFSMAAPVRGSSPTASLAADLSQNMNIDKSSPQYPTPRRSLFSSNNHFASQRVPILTPPLPLSSPGLTNDGMDISPLPHKAPCGLPYEPQLQSPTPEPTPKDLSCSPYLTPRSSSPVHEEITLQLPQERKRSNPLRPSLTRTKGLSCTAIPQCASPEAQLPPFKFGNGLPRSNPQSSLALSEIFEASSPIQEKTVSRFNASLMPAARVRQPFALGNNSRNASPLGQHMRKNSNPVCRPRKQFRRSLSMFEHPEDVMKQDRDTSVPALPSIVDMEVPHIPQLPHFFTDNQTCDLPRISRDTMIDVLDGKYDNLYQKRVVIDCRFEYEYKGGHISGAVNFNDKDQLASQLFDVEDPNSNALLIFHCEYSAHRAPLMAKHIRNRDRTVNVERYPGLSYPEAYILDGGYSAFYKDHSDRCFPQNYVEMDAKEHADACELGLGKVKQQQRSKLLRAQTYAFGQHSPSLDSSPTTMYRGRNNDDTDMDLSDFTPVPSRPTFLHGRGQRMLSY